MSVSEYCATCGEAFGPEKHGKRKKAKARKERKRQEFQKLQAGDKIKVTKVVAPSLRYTHRLWNNTDREKLVVGRVYKFCGKRWWSTVGIFEEFAVPNTQKFQVEPSEIEYEVLPRWYET